MKSGVSFRTVDLARAVGISVQQVRNYETWGFIPPARRGENDYRLYTAHHLAALRTAREMMSGYGWQQTLRIMQALHRNDCATALALMDARHAEFAAKRQQIQQTLEALRVISKETSAWKDIPSSRTFQIGEAAKQVGVRTSALHFWEQVELLQPLRDRNSGYRLYDEQQLHRLRVIVLLREAGYRFEVIHAVLDEITSGRADRAIQAIEKRNEELTRMSWACVEATASFREYIREFFPAISERLR